MKAVKEIIGKTTVFIQTIEENDFEIIGSFEEGPDIIDTGIEDNLKDVYKQAKSIIMNLNNDISTELSNRKSKDNLKQIEIEFNMGFSAQATAWIIGLNKNYALKVKMTWDSTNDV